MKKKCIQSSCRRTFDVEKSMKLFDGGKIFVSCPYCNRIYKRFSIPKEIQSNLRRPAPIQKIMDLTNMSEKESIEFMELGSNSQMIKRIKKLHDMGLGLKEAKELEEKLRFPGSDTSLY